MLQKPIYLCGMMGAGKSTTGPLLADLVNKPFADLDQIIEQAEQASIPDIFAKRGETYFRKREREWLIQCTEEYSGVLALGGGSLQNQNLTDLVKEKGWLIYLHVSTEQLAARLARSTGRPMLRKKKNEKTETRIAWLLEQREHFYKQAHFTIKTGTLSPKEIAQQIITKISTHAS